MKQLFAWLWQWRAGRASVPSLPAAPSAPEWTPVNARELARFLDTETGKLLMERARAMEYNSAVQCVRDAAAGQIKVPTFSDAIAWLQSLSRSGGDQPETDNVPPGESGAVERELAIA